MRTAVDGGKTAWVRRSRTTRGSTTIVRVRVLTLEPIDVSDLNAAKKLKRALAPLIQQREALRAFAEGKATPPNPLEPEPEPDEPELRWFEAEELLTSDESFDFGRVNEWGDSFPLDNSARDSTVVSLIERRLDT
jgi:hypothetical protein